VSPTAKPETLRDPSFFYRTIRGSKGPALQCESVSLEELAARYGTPLYVYSADMIRQRLKEFHRAFRPVPHTICYSVKANSSLAILSLLESERAGFDIVSGGELERVLRTKRQAAKNTVFSGVGKTVPEMEAAVKAGILLFNVESAAELRSLGSIAERLKKKAAIAIRVNPDVSAVTHPYISTGLHEHKFGVPVAEAIQLYEQAARHEFLSIAGVSVHIGSQITDVSSFQAALERVADLVRTLERKGHEIRYVDAGGGLGIHYQQAQQDFRIQVERYARAVMEPLRGLKIHLLLEPGRSIIGPAGVLLTRVIYRKTNNNKRFLIVDAAMNDLLRPSLYRAYHEIVPVVQTAGTVDKVDVVGPICETGDFLAHDRELPAVEEGALLAILDVGAYGSVLSSNYNSRGRAAEILVEGGKARVVRRRESPSDLMEFEQK
jgi:diaminopimelate decarboxylase